MRASRAHQEHQAAVSRRLAQLSAELASARVQPEPDWSGGVPDTHTRIRPGRFDPPHVPDPPPAPVADAIGGWRFAAETATPARLPLPGRHAARRSAGGRVGLPRPDLTRVAVGPAQLTVVAVVVAVVCAMTCWWFLQSPRTGARVDRATLGTDLVPAGAAGTTTPVVDGAEMTDTTGEVVVDVAGKVRRPGIVVLPEGSRVTDALEAAGGPRRGVDLSSLNLARRLVDGEQVLVGIEMPAGTASQVGASPAPAGGALVNLNQADQSQLEALPEIGPVTAQAIIAFRESHGGFTAIDELLDVDGIGDATLARLAPLVTV